MRGTAGRMGVAVVGVGLIGERRARVAASHPRTRVVVLADADAGRAARLASEFGCEHTTRWEEAVRRNDVDVVVVATPNILLAPVGLAALRAGKHVLCEKPMAVRAGEAERMVDAAHRARLVLKVGYNLRHHPAIAKAHELFSRGAVGEPLIVRACYGHGGRPGYEKEWRGDPALSGGGELIDQGVHLIDLSRWFLGDFSDVRGLVTTSFWKRAPVEDNVFAVLSAARGRVAHLHASWTQWRNRFRFELFGTGGYLIAGGLGGSYGPESLVLGIRNPTKPPPRERSWAFPEGDDSWRGEWREFIGAIRTRREPHASGRDGLQVLRVVEALYRSSRDGRAVDIGRSTGHTGGRHEKRG